MTSTTPGSTVEGGHVHAVTSETSVMSVMSEVKGDWGAVGRVKDDNRVSGLKHQLIAKFLFTLFSN